MGAGTIYVPARPQTRPVVERAASNWALRWRPQSRRRRGATLKSVRIGLWDQYGGSMPSGWLRWMFEQFEFPFEVVYPATLDQGDLAKRFDVLVFPSGAMPRASGRRTWRRGAPARSGRDSRGISQGAGPRDRRENHPSAAQVRRSGRRHRHHRRFHQSRELLGLPVNALVERTPMARSTRCPARNSTCPVRCSSSVDNTNPVAYGMPSVTDVFFENSPAFRLGPDAELKGVKPVAWFPNATPLRSGWAWGQGYLDGAVAAAEAPMGEGKVFLLGVEAAFRGQPHGTYKLLFNSIYAGPAKAATLTP